MVFLAGVTFNFVTAVIFSLILLCTLGYDIPQVTNYNPLETHIAEEEYIYNPSASLDALQEGDVIFAIDGQKIDFAFGKNFNTIIQEEQAEIISWVRENSNEDGVLNSDANFEEFPTMTFTIRRDGQMQDVEVAVFQIQQYGTDEDGNQIVETAYSFGISAKAYVHTFWEALDRCIPFAFGLAWVVLKSLWLLLTFQLGIDAIGGPITTIATMATVTQMNAGNLLLLIPLISANLAVFNLLPIPALDGSHVLFTLIEWIRGKPINRRVENIIHFVGLAIMFGLVILIDILHFVL